MPKTPTNPLIECVVNVSEGRDTAVLDVMSAAISGSAHLLHRDVGAGAHRTVFTFAGTPDGVFTAARELFVLADRHIDMQRHRGAHPRLGAVDVCPFVPIRGITYKELAARTRVLAEWVSQTLDLPIYLYERSATRPERQSLAYIRRGEYEGLSEKMASPDGWPDYGPHHPHPRLGATVMGVRPFLIAWNINLSPDATPAQAKTLAARLRGSGRKGNPGLFPGLRAIGWHIPEYGRCQISCNVIDPDRTPLAKVYFTAVNLAAGLGVAVTGSELIGLIPARHLRAAARDFYPTGDYAERMDVAVDLLGLNDLAPLNWRERVLEELLPTDP